MWPGNVAAPAQRPGSRAGWIEPASRVLLIAALALLVGRFWHPYYGFTRFIQFDEASLPTALPQVRASPLFIYPGENGYDAIAYVQIAFDPTVGTPGLAGAIDHLPYRARRIVLSALAWAMAGGADERIARAYALINPFAWLVLAALLWRILPTGDWRRTAGWAGVLFSAGALHSLRLGLTDLPALVLMAAALLWLEGGRRAPAAAGLAFAALTRETSVLSLAALMPRAAEGGRAWLRAAALAGMAVAPLAGWMAYLHFRLGPADPGVGNLAMPVVGFIDKLRVAAAEAAAGGPHAWLKATTLLATLGLAAQAAHLLWRREYPSPWWRMGAAFMALMLVLGNAVWEGHPGAATRVLLPLTLAFNVLAARRGSAWGWLLAGNLSVLSGVLALWHVPRDPREVAAGTAAGTAYVARTGGTWFGSESHRGETWAWSGRGGRLRINTWPQSGRELTVSVALFGMTPRQATVSLGGRELWRGDVTREPRWVDLGALQFQPGGLELEISSDAAPVLEGPGGRELGIACGGVRLDPATATR